MQTLDLVSHVRVRVRARAGRLVDTGHGPGPGRLEAGQAEGPLCVSRAAEVGGRRPGRGGVWWGKGAWVRLGALDGGWGRERDAGGESLAAAPKALPPGRRPAPAGPTLAAPCSRSQLLGGG
jgi:hypothetical protein